MAVALVLAKHSRALTLNKAAKSAAGKMSRKRTAYDMRMIAKNRLGDYFARLVDELMFMYLSGARGINEDFIEDIGYTGFANNAFTSPDAAHHSSGGRTSDGR